MFAVSKRSKKIKSQANIPNWDVFGMLQRAKLQNAMQKIAKIINLSLLPKYPTLALSDKCPTKGSLIPSHKDAMPIAKPTRVPESPIIDVQKNIKKEPIVCDRALYPNPPMP